MRDARAGPPDPRLRKALLWVVVSTTGGLLAATIVGILSYIAPFNPFTVSGFAAGQFAYGGLFGLVVAMAQAFLIRSAGIPRWRWIMFTALGFSMAVFVGISAEAIVPQLRNPLGYMIDGIAMGMWVGLAQWLAIGRYLDRPLLWSAVSGIAWGISLGIGRLLMDLTILGSGLLYGLLTAYPFAVLVGPGDRSGLEKDSA